MSDHFLAEYFGKVFPVPQYGSTFFPMDKFVDEGNIVTWEVNQKRKGKQKFMAKGKVIGVYMTTFGGSKRKPAARIETGKNYLAIYPGRKITTVAVDKLTVVKN